MARVASWVTCSANILSVFRPFDPLGSVGGQLRTDHFDLVLQLAVLLLEPVRACAVPLVLLQRLQDGSEDALARAHPTDQVRSGLGDHIGENSTRVVAH